MYTYLCYATLIHANICKLMYIINVYAFICECEMLSFIVMVSYILDKYSTTELYPAQYFVH